MRSMNRSGFAGALFEMDDGFTSLTAERLASLRCDGGKMLHRLDLSGPASGRTILAFSQELNELGRHRPAKFLQPLSVIRQDQKLTTQTDLASMVHQCGIAPTLGDFANGVASSACVPGTFIGSNLLFPGDADPLANVPGTTSDGPSGCQHGRSVAATASTRRCGSCLSEDSKSQAELRILY
jgi:Cgl0159-like